MASRTELKATFSGGNKINESDFALLIDSLAHLNDDKANGDIIGQSDLTGIQTAMSQLEALAQSAKDTADAVGTNHPTYNEMRAEDQLIKTQALDLMRLDTASIEAVNTSQQAKLDSLETSLNSSISLFSADISSLLANQVSVGTKADLSYVVSLKASTDSDIATKAPLVHSHPEYATKVSLASSNFITLADIPLSAPPIHNHLPTDIVGLNDLFTTPAEVDQKISDARNTLDQLDQLYDVFYDKDEVDFKFYTARWRIDQISLFNPAVVSIAQPLVSIARYALEVSIADVRASLFADKTSILNTLAQTRAEIEVSIGNTNSTVETNRQTAEQGRITLQGNIDQTAINASASIASSQTHVLGQLANVRAEVLAETQANATAITQAENDANSYTDTKISDLLGGAGAAYDTLKELQEHIETNKSDAATELTNQVGILQGQLDSNDNELGYLQTFIHGASGSVTPPNGFASTDGVINRLVALETDTTVATQIADLQAQITSLTNQHNTLQGLHDALQTAHNTMQSRLTTLENTAYAAAGYVFP